MYQNSYHLDEEFPIDRKVLCILDNEPDAIYQVELNDALRELAWRNRCHTRLACKVLRRATEDDPMRGDCANFWME